MSKESNIPSAVRFKRYGQHDNVPKTRDGKTARDKASGSWANHLLNVAMRGDESRQGPKRKRSK
jgi:hypothetical protein